MAVDVRKWLNDNMAALNLGDEDKAAAERLLNGQLGQRLGQSLYRQEDVSNLQSALDRQRAAAEAERQRLEQWNLSWQQRYEEDVADLGGIDKLAAAGFDTSGYVGTQGGGVQNQQTGQAFSADQVAQMLREQEQRLLQSVDAQRAGLVDYATFVSDFGPSYRETYGKKFDAAGFRKFAYEHRDRYPTLESAAEAFTAEDRRAKEESDRKTWEAQKEKEIELRLMSSMNVPEAAGNSAEGAPFHAITDKAKPGDVQPSRVENRQEFARKWQGQDFNVNI